MMYIDIWVLAVAWLVVGLIIGSFINVVIHRWVVLIQQWENNPNTDDLEMRWFASLFFPRSHCPHCQTPIFKRDLIPVISWLWLMGRCRFCRASIHWQYPVVELLNASWWLWIGVFSPWREHFFPSLAWAILGSLIIIQAFIDLFTRWLPTEITQCILWLGILISLLKWHSLPLDQALWGVIVGYLFLWVVRKAYWLWRKKIGMGSGDGIFLSAVGAWLGPEPLLAVVLLASLLGLVYGAVTIKTIQTRQIPFAPFMGLATLLLVVVGPTQFYRLWGF